MSMAVAYPETRQAPQAGKIPAGAALRAFFNMADLWKLSAAQQMTLLGITAQSTFFKWKSDADNARLSRDTLEQVSKSLG